MPWLDPARRIESDEDRVLRAELQQLLALPPPAEAAAPTPDTRALADDLLREALRRRHTPTLVPRPRRPNRLLLAAGLPLALALTGTGIWGFQQKRKAEALALDVARKEAEVQRLNRSQQQAIERERSLHQPNTEMVKEKKPVKGKHDPAELVIPGPRTNRNPILETSQVKDR